MKSKLDMDKPIPFIESVAGKLSVNEEAVKVLREISNPVTVVTIAGLYRTGKSYILNRMFGLYRTGRSFFMNKLYGETTQFELGSTIQAKTKGIWIWCRPHPFDSERYLVLLDTEGLGDVELGDTDHDISIFSLSILLCSCFIYNSIGTINQYAINELQLVTELTEHIKVKAAATEESGEEFGKHFPMFIWAVRDFTLEKIIDGRKVTSDEYLENSLKLKNGTSRKIMDYNLPRETLQKFFPIRHCFTLPRPCVEEKICHVERLPDNEISPEFLEIIRELNYFVYTKAPTKTFEGKPTTGCMLADLATIYVEAIANGRIPCIQTAFETVSKIECQKAINEGIKMYSETMDKMLHLPTTLKNFSSVHEEALGNATRIFLSINIFDKDHTYKNTFLEMIDRKFKTFEKDNAEASRIICTEVLKNLYEPIKSKLINGDFIHAGGYEEYLTFFKDLKSKYILTRNKGVQADAAFAQFLEEVQADEMQIIAADKRMTELEKQEAAKEARLEALNANTAALQIRQRQMEEASRVNMENFKIKMAELESTEQEAIRRKEKLNDERTSDSQRFREELEKTTNDMKTQVNFYDNQIKSLKDKVEQTSQEVNEKWMELEALK